MQCLQRFKDPLRDELDFVFLEPFRIRCRQEIIVEVF